MDSKKYPNRKSIRLTDFDYNSEAFYFLTICTHNRACHFGKIIEEKMELNEAGKMIEKIWSEIPQYYKGSELDLFVVMPNHLHGIINLRDTVPRTNIFEVMNRFKTFTTTLYIRGVKEQGWPQFDNHLWQRNYFDRVIRNEKELFHIREYIAFNPVKWHLDNYFPKTVYPINDHLP